MEHPSLVKNETLVPEFLSGGGELGQRIREYDWANTSLGPVETWPQSLRTCIRIMLTSRQPIWIGWGRELIKFYNDPYKAIVGGKHPWALGKPASLVWKDIWRDIEPMLKQVMEKDQGIYVESKLLIMERNGYPEETYYTFSYTPVPGDDGKTGGMFCANTDDTEKIISERQLRTLTQLGKGLVDCKSNKEIIEKAIATLAENPQDFPFVIFRQIVDGKAVFVHATPLGNASPLIVKEYSLSADNEVAAIIKKTIATRKPQVFNDLLKKVGELPKGAWEASPDKLVVLPIIGPTKEPYGILSVGLNPYRLLDEKYLGFFSLVTDQIATSFADVYVLEEERKRAEALAEIDRAKTVFFTNISHEFRTPLTLMLGSLEELMHKDNGETSAGNKEKIETSHRNALRLLRLVNNLLDFSRLEAGRVNARFQLTDIATLTENLASNFRSAIENAGLRFDVNCSQIFEPVYVDKEMWEKVVLNLLSNAFKYTLKGSIVVSLDTVPLSNSAGETVGIRLKVADTGVGIPENELPNMFQRFHRIQNLTGRSFEGTGIGLSLVKELVQLHGGEISVASRQGEGSSFTIVIPTGKAHLPASQILDGNVATSKTLTEAFLEEAMLLVEKPAPEKTKTTSKATLTVLVVDDNPDMRHYIANLLQTDFNVLTATNGQEALETIKMQEVKLVVSDVMMPVMDGIELLRAIKDLPQTTPIPVILVSARAGEEAKIEGFDIGADDYLIKPFSAKELQARVRSQIAIAQRREHALRDIYNMFEEVPFAVAVLKGEDLVIEYINQYNLRVWQRRKEEVLGKPLFEARPDIRVSAEGLHREVYSTGKRFVAAEIPIELMIDGKTELRYFNAIIDPLRNEEGKIIGQLATSIDITEQVLARKKIEEVVRQRTTELTKANGALVTSNQELTRLNQNLEDFAYAASHDMKEPIRKIHFFSDRLKSQLAGILSGEQKQIFERLENASRRMSTLIDDLLSYSQATKGLADVEVVDLNYIIRTVLEDLELEIEQRKAHFTIDPLPTVRGNQRQLQQLFQNLISNALKYTKPDLRPNIQIASGTVKGREAKPDLPDVVAAKEFYLFEVSDNGIGFPQEDAQRIFNVFTRLHGNAQYKGTGVGLSIAQKVVQNHDGHIWAESNPGEGTSFKILLPKEEQRG